MRKINLPKFKNDTVFTMGQLLQNPTGKGSSNMASRARIIETLEHKYYMLLRKNNSFDYKVYSEEENYIFVFKIPSESNSELFYDVVIELKPLTDDAKNGRNVTDYNISVFSNSPHFTFTYTYVMNDNGLLVDWCKSKCHDMALTVKPNTKNPVEQYGFEKSIYYACLFIRENKLYSKATLKKIASKFHKAKVLKDIASDTAKKKEYDSLKKSSKKKGSSKKKPIKETKPRRRPNFKNIPTEK